MSGATWPIAIRPAGCKRYGSNGLSCPPILIRLGLTSSRLSMRSTALLMSGGTWPGRGLKLSPVSV